MLWLYRKYQVQVNIRNSFGINQRNIGVKSE